MLRACNLFAHACAFMNGARTEASNGSWTVERRVFLSQPLFERRSNDALPRDLISSVAFEAVQQLVD